jgi:IS4 transposase
MRPVQKGDRIGEIVRELFWQARERVNISMVYADTGFWAADTSHAFKEAGVNCVIPSPKNKRVKREMDRMQQEIEVKHGYTIYGHVLGGRGQRPAETNLVLHPSSKDDSKTVAFITNEDVDDEIRLDRVETKGLINRYSRRWGIENSYKTIKDFLAWTTSKELSVRIFYFSFAVLLYNMWLLVDLVVQVSLDVKHRYKPRVTAKRFLNLVRKQLAGIG